MYRPATESSRQGCRYDHHSALTENFWFQAYAIGPYLRIRTEGCAANAGEKSSAHYKTRWLPPYTNGQHPPFRRQISISVACSATQSLQWLIAFRVKRLRR